MAWSNPALLFGVLLVAAPIVLHLLMRQRPKRIEFPAIRFVSARQASTSRRMRLQHMVLLSLRCLLVVVAALALAGPSVANAVASRWTIAAMLAVCAVGLLLLALAMSRQERSNASHPWLIRGLLAAAAALGLGGMVTGGAALSGADALIGDQEAPVAAALVFDTSPRMEFLHANESSIDRARSLALRLIRELPRDSEVAVLDSRRRGAFWAADRSAARAALQRLEPTGAPASLPDIAADAVQLAADSTLARREVYVFTDLSQGAWEGAGEGAGKARLQELLGTAEVGFYVMDIGALEPANLSLDDLRLSAVTLPKGGRLRVDTNLSATGLAGEYQVRLEVEELSSELPVIQDGETRLPSAESRDRKLVSVDNGQSAPVRLSVSLDAPGVRHGRVVIESTSVGDSLAVDNQRWFTVEVREAWPVLVAQGPAADADFLVQALAPVDYEDFDCQVIDQRELPTVDLSNYAAVCLLDPGPMDDALWQRLDSYVRRGGALWTQLGRNARSDPTFNGTTAQELLGAPLARQWRTGDRSMFITVRDPAHPALTLFRDGSAAAAWANLPIYKHWVLQPLPADARVLTGFSNNRHASMYERSLGDGTVVVSATPLTDTTYSPQAWNELAFGENNWPPFILSNELMLYLVRGSESRLNYWTGETVELENDPRVQPRRYQLFLPDEPPQDVTAQDGRLRMPYTASPGQYRLKGARGGVVLRGFSCNLPAALTDLKRLEPAALDRLLGDDRYQLAREYSQLQRVQNRQRVGREFFSVLMTLLAGLMVIEYLVANRFYRPTAAGTDRQRVVESAQATLRAGHGGTQRPTGGAP